MCKVFRSTGKGFVGFRIIMAVVVLKSNILCGFIISFTSYSQFDHSSLGKRIPYGFFLPCCNPEKQISPSRDEVKQQELCIAQEKVAWEGGALGE